MLFTCQQDDFKSKEQNNSNKYPDIHSQILSLDEVQQNSKLQKYLKKISNNFDVNQIKTKNKTSNSTSNIDTNSKIDASDGSFSILTDEILYVTSNGGEAYSFKIETPLLAEATFENFVIIDNGEDIEFYIYSYITLDISGEIKHFLISILPIEDDLIDVIDFQCLINAKMHLINGCLYNIPEDGGSIQLIWCLGNSGGSSISGGGSPTTGGDGWVYTDIDGDGDCLKKKLFL